MNWIQMGILAEDRGRVQYQKRLINKKQLKGKKVKLWLCLTNWAERYDIKTYGRVDIQIHVFLTSAQLMLSVQLHVSATLPKRKELL
jgi:uncharacterized protein YlaI